MQYFSQKTIMTSVYNKKYYELNKDKIIQKSVINRKKRQEREIKNNLNEDITNLIIVYAVKCSWLIILRDYMETLEQEILVLQELKWLGTLKELLDKYIIHGNIDLYISELIKQNPNFVDKIFNQKIPYEIKSIFPNMPSELFEEK
jgi:hypothetical protein